ncbi:integrase_H2C2 domain-containing protein [Nephila pilipes]|uniref:Integrase_H2C2 domain-containing protein n=3 Tax=Nephila pilipes TaxID=299642 RepID=A0A8X6TGR9_NEPPI|nr:integrase_H2C2 domain-containing protein [Nephila pilipes]
MVNIQTADIMSDYFSTYSRNVRVVAWILRFIHNISNVNKLRGNLVYEEFKKAENLVFKSMQLRSFQDEKFLAKMQAFKDEEGLLRIRTKLVDSDEKEDFKFPVLLPANDVVVKLIREEHKKAMHADSLKSFYMFTVLVLGMLSFHSPRDTVAPVLSKVSNTVITKYATLVSLVVSHALFNPSNLMVTPVATAITKTIMFLIIPFPSPTLSMGGVKLQDSQAWGVQNVLLLPPMVRSKRNNNDASFYLPTRVAGVKEAKELSVWLFLLH